MCGMAEDVKKDAAAEAPEAGSPEEQAAASAAKNKKNKMMIAIAGALVVIGGGVGGFFMLSGGKEEAAHEEANKPVAVYADVPQFAIQIPGDSDQNHFMKLSVTLELAKPEDVEKVKMLMPRVQDDFNAFLMNLRVEDLRGSAGLQRVKDALLLRANQVLSPIVLSNVLYKEILVQ